MLLKAQILWEGYGKADTAEKYLNRIREMTTEDDKFHRWSTRYLEKVGKWRKRGKCHHGIDPGAADSRRQMVFPQVV